jgi:putative Mg2+ transporter-C (MgtC) family protein
VPAGLDFIFPLLASLLFGGAIGLERERQERAAGLRTVTMVCLGSCLFTLLSIHGFQLVASSDPNLRSDPARVAAQIVTGIGFLGAGTIFLRKDLVRGLTTAATIWATAAIGMAAATEQYFAAFFATLLVLIVLMVLKPIERRIFKRSYGAAIAFLMPRIDNGPELVRAALRPIGASPQAIRFQEVSPTEDRLEFDLEVPASCGTNDILRQLRTVPGLHQVSISQELWEEGTRAGT